MIWKGEWDSLAIPNETAYRPVQIIDYAGHGRELQRIYLWLPKAGGESPVTVWFHGGGMMSDVREVPGCLFDGTMAVAECRYRLSPDHPATTALADAAAAIAHVLNNVNQYHLAATRVFVGGMSAGAYLAAMMGCAGSYLAAHGFDHRKLAGLLIISGQLTTHFQLKIDLRYPQNQCHPVVDLFAPLYYVSADLAPMLLVTGESDLDIPGRMEENALMAATLRSIGHRLIRCHHLAGCDHGGAFHNSEPYISAFLKEVQEAAR